MVLHPEILTWSGLPSVPLDIRRFNFLVRKMFLHDEAATQLLDDYLLNFHVGSSTQSLSRRRLRGPSVSGAISNGTATEIY